MTTQKNQLSTRYTKNLINFISEIDHNKINNIVEIIKKKSKKKKKFLFLVMVEVHQQQTILQ